MHRIIVAAIVITVVVVAKGQTSQRETDIHMPPVVVRPSSDENRGERLLNREHQAHPDQPQTPKQPTVPAPMPSLRIVPNANIIPDVLAKMTVINAAFFAATGKNLVITSGTRTPHQQAELFFQQLQADPKALAKYMNRSAADAIVKTFLDGQASGAARDAIVAAIREIVAKTVSSRPISNHLSSGAVDLSISGLTIQEQATMVNISLQNGARALIEGPRGNRDTGELRGMFGQNPRVGGGIAPAPHVHIDLKLIELEPDTFEVLTSFQLLEGRQWQYWHQMRSDSDVNWSKQVLYNGQILTTNYVKIAEQRDRRPYGILLRQVSKNGERVFIPDQQYSTFVLFGPSDYPPQADDPMFASHWRPIFAIYSKDGIQDLSSRVF